ncbi:MAG: NifB/NifX family molybdenum-iron cluster-binding protein [Anaerolineae bacterium]|nr:NifB/NifX family molybdenum-iron cluster-binding protein [Anaerolineae bacterium]
MKIVISSNGVDLDAPCSPIFGRASTYIFVDTETMAFEALPNPAMGASGGAGIQSAQFIVNQGAQAVVTGNVGPNAFEVLQSAGIPIYLFTDGTVRQAAEMVRDGTLSSTGGATAAEHSGMRRRSAPAPSTPTRGQQVAALQEKARALRKELATIIEQIDQLEGGT